MIGAGEMLSLYYPIGVTGDVSSHVSDGTYACPTERYLCEEFANFYADKLESMGLGNWETTWDCDNFAWMYYTDIQWAHYATKKSTAEGISVGVCYYMAGARAEDGSGGGHAINTAVVKENGEYKILFIEPQFAAVKKPCVLTLTPEEIASIWLINF